MNVTKPILAVDLDDSKVTFPIFILPKIDGVRAINLTGAITSRTLKPFGNSNVSLIFNDPEMIGIDGEMVYQNTTSPSLCRDTTSVMNTHNDARAGDLIWCAFDYITEETANLPYAERYKMLKDHLQANDYFGDKVSLVTRGVVSSMDEVLESHKSFIDSGFEGTILRNPFGLYKSGRTTQREANYLRIKDFAQDEAIVLSIVEAQENKNEKITNELGLSTRSTHKDNKAPKGMVGALVCQDEVTKAVFNVGAGNMTKEERIYFFSNQQSIINKRIAYKHFPVGRKEKPRFPTFVYIRPDNDMVTE